MDVTNLDENSLVSYVSEAGREGDEQYLPESQAILVTDDARSAVSQYIEEKDYDSTLIALVTHFPVLYNKQCANYKDSSMRENCWREIGAIVNRPAVDCSKRWAQLRDSYAREKRRRDEETRSGSGATMRKGFSFYNDMDFLREHVQKRKTFTNVVVSTPSRVNRTPFRPIVMKNCAVRQPLSYVGTPVRTAFLGTSPCVRASTPPVNVPEATLPVRIPIPPLSSLTPSPNLPTLPMTVPSSLLPFDMPIPTPPSTPTPPTTITTPITTTPITTTPITTAPVTTTPITTTPITITPITTTPRLTVETTLAHCSMSRPSSTLSSYSSLSSCSDASSSFAFDVDDNVLYDLASDSKIPAQSRLSLSQNVVSERPPSQQGATHVSSWMNTNCKENVRARDLPQPKMCFNKDSGKRQKPDPVEISFLNLSSTLQKHFENAVHKEKEIKSTTSDQAFAKLIVSELETMSEPLKTTTKSRLLQVLFEQKN